MPVLPVRFIKLSQDRKSKVNLILMMIECFFAERSKFFIYDNWQILYFFSTTQANKGTAYQSTNFFMHWLQIIMTNRNDSFKESTRFVSEVIKLQTKINTLANISYEWLQTNQS